MVGGRQVSGEPFALQEAPDGLSFILGRERVEGLADDGLADPACLEFPGNAEPAAALHG